MDEDSKMLRAADLIPEPTADFIETLRDNYESSLQRLLEVVAEAFYDAGRASRDD